MIEVYTDGASRGNPGPSGVGIYIKTGNEQFEYTIPIGQMTNNEAEFHAIIEALKICQKQFSGEIISLRSDSTTVVDAVDNNYVKNKVFQPLLTEIQHLSEPFPFVFIKWIPQKENSNADRLAKKAIYTQ